MFKAILFDKENKYINDFILLPKLLYSSNTITQNEKLERDILQEKHPLCKYFDQHKIIVYNNDEVCGRAIVTIFKNSDVAYIGYFESINNYESAKAIFDKAEECAMSNNINKIVGPVDSSFWIKYRLKIDKFDKSPYTGEPYNKEYYRDLFERNGYKISDIYSSRIYKKVEPFKTRNKYRDRLKLFKEKGYKFISPSQNDYDKILEYIYNMVSQLYSNFPAYTKITFDEFKYIFKDLKYIVDNKLIKIVYFENKPVAFFIGIPDYSNMLNSEISFYKYIRILLKKFRSNNYILLYMGVLPGHKGLGSALAQEIMNFLELRKSTSIGALIAQGKETGVYAKELIEDSYNYCILEKNL
jgi:hypothetical protein